MDERKQIARDLEAIREAMKQLEIKYELYFAGEERREPVKARENLRRKLLHFSNRRISQTNLRFQFQNLATRFHSYQGYWDRILRLMDEGKYHRHLATLKRPAKGNDAEPARPLPEDSPAKENLYDQVRKAYADCGLEHKAPSKPQLDKFLEKQQNMIRDRYGDRDVQFVVETSEGKPVIRAKAKRE